MNQGHLRDVEHKKDGKHREYHEIPRDVIKQVPELLKRPALIYDSISEENKENSVCVLTTKCDKDGNPIIIIIENSDRGSSYLNLKMETVKVKASNYVKSLYEREGFFSHMGDVINNDSVLYSSKNGMEKLFAEIDRINQKKEKPKLNSDSKLELLARLDNLGFDIIIHQSRNVVNTKSMQNGEVYSGGVKVTIPEGNRIVKNIVLDDESAAFRRSNPKGYKVIETMAQDLGMRVKFVKGLTDSDGKVLDGVITSEGIFINTESKNPTRFAATHEFSHRMKKASPEIWQRYQDFVIDKLKIDGRYYKVFELKAAAYGNNNEAYINEEIAADYIGDLFNNVSELADFIRESRRNAVTVRDVWYGILDKLGLLDEKKKAQRMWRDAYKKAMDNVEDGKVGEYSGENASRRVDKKKRTPYNEYYTNALKWARATDRRPGDVTTISVDYYTSALIEATADGFVELAKGSYKEVKAEYERVYSEKDKSFHAYTEEIRSERDPNMWNMQFAEDGEYAPGNGEQIRDTEFQDDTTGNNEYLRSGNKRKSVSGTRLSDADSSVIDATPQSAVPTAPLAGEPSDAEGGFIKPGAEPRRDVKVPKSVEEGTKVRQFARTAAEAETLTDETAEGVLENVEQGRFSYTPISDKSAMNNAYATMDALGIEWVDKKVSDAIESHSLDKNTVAMAEVLLQKNFNKLLLCLSAQHFFALQEHKNIAITVKKVYNQNSMYF